MRAGRHADAVREFKAALPILMATARENANDDDTTARCPRARLQSIVEAYISLLATTQKSTGDVAVETFGLADAIRGQSVQQALISVERPHDRQRIRRLAELIRKEQDLTKQVNAQLGVLTNVLALPVEQRDEQGVKAINATIDKVRSDRDKARAEIGPSLSELCRARRSQGADRGERAGQPCARTRRCCRSISGARRASYGPAEKRTGGIRVDPAHRRANLRQRLKD